MGLARYLTVLPFVWFVVLAVCYAVLAWWPIDPRNPHTGPFSSPDLDRNAVLLLGAVMVAGIIKVRLLNWREQVATPPDGESAPAPGEQRERTER